MNQEKEKYENMEIEIIQFGEEDVITTSNEGIELPIEPFES